MLSRDTNLAVPRVPSSLEIAYLGGAGDLCQMIADGTFPSDEPSPGVHTSPRVGDGLIRVDAAGAVVFASPNALSAYHRMGHAADLIGVRPLAADPLADRRPVRRDRGRHPDPRRPRRPGQSRGSRPRRGTARPCCSGRFRCSPRERPPARWCWSATSPRSSAATAQLLSQGRDHPGNPSPGEEQPADGRGAAAAAVPPDVQREARDALTESVRRVTSIAHGARNAGRSPSTSGSTWTSWSTGWCR